MSHIIFTLIACLAALALADLPFITDYQAYQSGQYGDLPSQTFNSSNISAPHFAVTTWNPAKVDPAPYLFADLDYVDDRGNHWWGPHIFDSRDLSLVYADQTYPHSNNARMQRYKDNMLLTYWEGDQGTGHATGHCVMMNHQYRVVYNISTVGLRSNVDLHECQITDEGTVLVTAYEKKYYQLSSVGGKQVDWLLDSVFQEIDIETGELIFTWAASEHIPVTDSFKRYQEDSVGWDAYHINSLQKNPEGDYLVSLRRTHELVLVNHTSGDLIWRLGGRHSNFSNIGDGQPIDFAWQHHARFVDDAWTELTLFDNRALEWDHAVGCQGPTCSRGLKVKIDYNTMSAELVKEYYSPEGIGAYAMGSYDELPTTGNALIGWGSMAGFTEYTPEGEVVMNVLFGTLGSWVRTYRVYKSDWVGYPLWAPAINVTGAEGERNVYMSWNGATGVKKWQVEAAREEEGFEGRKRGMLFREVQRAGFETSVAIRDLGREMRFLRARALDAEGTVIGVTAVVDRWTGEVRKEGWAEWKDELMPRAGDGDGEDAG